MYTKNSKAKTNILPKSYTGVLLSKKDHLSDGSDEISIFLF